MPELILPVGNTCGVLLTKVVFAAKTINSTIQMEFLSEVRTPDQVLHYAQSRERTRESETNFMSTRQGVPQETANINKLYAPRDRLRSTKNNKQKYPQCWRYSGSFVSNHNIVCQGKESQCNFCKKMGHYAKM